MRSLQPVVGFGQRPIRGAVVDWSHPHARRLVFASLLGDSPLPFDLVTGRPAANKLATVRPSPGGMAADVASTSGGTDIRWPTGPDALNLSTQFSFVTVVMQYSITITGNGAIARCSDASGNGWGFSYTSTGATFILVVNPGGNQPMTIPQQAGLQCFGLSYIPGGSRQRFFRNGAFEEAVTSTRTPNINASKLTGCTGGSSGPLGTYQQLALMAWDVALPDAQMVGLTENPYALFRQPVRYWAFPGASSASATAQFARIFTGAGPGARVHTRS